MKGKERVESRRLRGENRQDLKGGQKREKGGRKSLPGSQGEWGEKQFYEQGLHRQGG